MCESLVPLLSLHFVPFLESSPQLSHLLHGQYSKSQPSCWHYEVTKSTALFPDTPSCMTLFWATSNSCRLYLTLSVQHLGLAPVHKWVLFAPCSSRPVIQCHSFPFSSSKWHSRCQPTAGQAESCRGWVHTKHWDKQGLQTFPKNCTTSRLRSGVL